MDNSAKQNLEFWLSRHQRFVLLFLFFSALIIRFCYFAELAKGPLVQLHRWQATDMHYYDSWARQIAAGDWLTNRSHFHYTEWHANVAAEYFKQYPAQQQSLINAANSAETSTEHSRALWERWHGGKQFHKAPLYIYLIAVIYKAFGPDPRWVFALQLLLGAFGVVLVYLIARRCLGHVAGSLCGVLAVLSSPPLFYEMVLLRSSLINFLGLLLVWLSMLALEKKTWQHWLLAGGVLGLAVMTKPTLALFGLGQLYLLFHFLRRNARRWLKLTAALVCGVTLCLLPLFLRNLTVGAPFFSISRAGPMVFATTNTEDYRDEFGFFVSPKYMHKILKKSEGRFLPTVMATLSTHPHLGSYLTQLWGKFRYTWHWFEIPNNVNFYYFRQHSVVLKYLPVTFWLIASLGLIGLIFGRSRIACLLPLYLLVATHLIPMIMFNPLSRYRGPLMIALIPFAALALIRWIEIVQHQRFKLMALVSAGFIMLASWLLAPLPPSIKLIRPTYYLVPFDFYYIPAAKALHEANDWPRLFALLNNALKHEPPFLREIGTRPRRRPSDSAEAMIVKMFANLHGIYGQALLHMEQPRRARAQELRARELLAAAQSQSKP